ncbi:MAG: hypothetical protein ACXU82_10595 [Caulobacteraceae bacterium]
MLKWALLCLLVALAAAFGQTATLDASTQGAVKVLCYACLALFVLLVGIGGTSRRI